MPSLRFLALAACLCAIGAQAQAQAQATASATAAAGGPMEQLIQSECQHRDARTSGAHPAQEGGSQWTSPVRRAADGLHQPRLTPPACPLPSPADPPQA